MARLDELLAMLGGGRLRPCVQNLFARAAERDTGDGDWRYVRAPGRVNLIGEHTDYNGLPVMPMAINREIVALFRPLPDGRVSLESADGFGERSFVAGRDIEPFESGDWGNYAKAAVQELMRKIGPPRPAGFDAIVGGDIPDGAGLSSSSALVVAMGLVFASVNDLRIAPARMADLMADGERYVGTRGGGMDQAACLLGEDGLALRMDFGPLRVRPVPLPEGAEVIVANSMVRAEKSAGARARFNLRAAECAMACALLGRHYGQSFALLADFYAACDDPEAAIEGVMEQAPMTASQITSKLNLTQEEFERRFLLQSDGAVLPAPETGFQPYRRARHVLSETRRVEMARQAMQTGDLAGLGRCLDASHASCRDDYEISCPELEALTAAAIESGAAGARLTGAGFGGCIVALASSEAAPEVLNGIRERYHEGWLTRHRPDLAARAGSSTGHYLFTSRPQAGASVLPDETG